MNRNESGFVIAAFVIILLLVSLGYVAWRVYDSGLEENKKSVTEINKCEERADDCTYENEMFGFGISYPSRWGEVLEVRSEDLLNSQVSGYVAFNFFDTGVIQLGGPLRSFSNNSTSRFEYASGINGQKVEYQSSFNIPDAEYEFIVNYDDETGLVSYEVMQDEKTYYHAIFELRNELSAINIWAEAEYLDKSTFDKVVRSVTIK